MREVNGMREDNFFAEPIVESKGHKLAPADTSLTIQSQNGPINESTKENPEVLVSEIPEKILAIPQR